MRAALGLLGGLLAFFVARNHGFFFADELLIWRDLAANCIGIERAREFQQLLGPHSRVGATHPGPISFYYLAFTEPLLRFLPALLARYHLAQLLLNAAMIAYVVRNIGHLSPRRNAPSLFVACAVLAVFAVPMTYSQVPLCGLWGPALGVVPMLVFGFGLSQIAIGRWQHAPMTALASVLAVHNHFGTAAVIAPSILIVAVYMFRRHPLIPRGRSERWYLASALLILLALWTPPLIEQLQPGGGNLGELLSVGSDQGGINQPPGLALEGATKGLAAPAMVPFVSIPGREPGLLFGVLALVLLGTALWWSRCFFTTEAKAWLVVSGLLIALYFASGIVQPYNIKWYAFNGTFGLAGGIYFLALDGLGARAASREGTRLSPNTIGLLLTGLVTLAAVGAIVRQPIMLYRYEYDGRYEEITTRLIEGRADAVVMHAQRKSSDARLRREIFGLSHHLIRSGYEPRTTQQLRDRDGNAVAGADGSEPLFLFTWHEPCQQRPGMEIGGFRILDLPVPEPPDEDGPRADPIPVGEWLTLSDPRLHFEGWTIADSMGRWTRGLENRLRVQGDPNSPIPIRFEAEASLVRPQLTVVYVNGVAVGSLRFEGEGPRKRYVPVPEHVWRPGGWNELVFHTPLACEPPSGGITPSEDEESRIRGIQMHSLRFVGAEDLE